MENMSQFDLYKPINDSIRIKINNLYSVLPLLVEAENQGNIQQQMRFEDEAEGDFSVDRYISESPKLISAYGNKNKISGKVNYFRIYYDINKIFIIKN